MMFSAALVASVLSPAHAQPDQVPDPGSRPAPAGEVPLPDGSFVRPPEGTAPDAATGPLAAEIAELEVEIGRLTSQLGTVTPEIPPAEAAVATAEQQWRVAREELTAAQQALDELVGESYRGAAALPRDLYGPRLAGLSAHAPVPVDAPLGVAAAARELVRARQAEQATAERYRATQETRRELTARHATLEARLGRLTAELATLRERNTDLLIAAEREREAAAQEEAADLYPVLEPVRGYQAGPVAEQAVRYALQELGEPYLWGAEGPDRFDCSGLMLWSYGRAGVTLPRVAADQYRGTRDRLVTRSAFVAQQGLLPGDLVFFSSGSSWQSIHHVGMYVGDGHMVHAPNRNELVQVSPVWWSRFYAATRVVEAVPVQESTAPTPGPTAGPPPSPSPTPPAPGPGPTTGPTSGPGGPDPRPTTASPTPTGPGPGGTTTPPTTSSPSASPTTNPPPTTTAPPTDSSPDSSPSPSSATTTQPATATPTKTPEPSPTQEPSPTGEPSPRADHSPSDSRDPSPSQSASTSVSPTPR